LDKIKLPWDSKLEIQMGKENKMRNYLNKINPVIERLIVDLLVDMPEDFVRRKIANVFL